MKGFGLRGAALACVVAFSFAGPAIAGGFAGSARPAHAPYAGRLRLLPSLSHRDERTGRTEFDLGAPYGERFRLRPPSYREERARADELELGAPVYATSDTESAAAPSPTPEPVGKAPFFYAFPPYAAPFEVVESHGPRIIYIGRDETPPSPTVGPKIIYGDEQASNSGGAKVIYGDR